jgi:TetR/AcrR family transcriptional regulator, mexJK operon transcriptional repressor
MAMGKEMERRELLPRPARDERRDAIVAIAHEAFLANGYAGTSMSAIAARLGGSKGTLYNYFSSKDELFTAVIERKSEQFLRALYDAEIEGGDLRSALTQFCLRFLELALADDSIATYRLVTAECARFPEIGHTLYTTGPQRGREHMSRFLARAKHAGQLRSDADVELAAEQICALCLFGIHQRRLWLVTPTSSPEEIRTQAEGAVSTFLRAFGA